MYLKFPIEKLEGALNEHKDSIRILKTGDSEEFKEYSDHVLPKYQDELKQLEKAIGILRNIVEL